MRCFPINLSGLGDREGIWRCLQVAGTFWDLWLIEVLRNVDKFRLGGMFSKRFTGVLLHVNGSVEVKCCRIISSRHCGVWPSFCVWFVLREWYYLQEYASLLFGFPESLLISRSICMLYIKWVCMFIALISSCCKGYSPNSRSDIYWNVAGLSPMEQLPQPASFPLGFVLWQGAVAHWQSFQLCLRGFKPAWKEARELPAEEGERWPFRFPNRCEAWHPSLAALWSKVRQSNCWRKRSFPPLCMWV